MRKTVVAVIAAALTLTAIPAQAATLPRPNEALLKAAMKDLPSADATGALIRITGSAGTSRR